MTHPPIHPHIGSHHSIRENEALWRFSRNSQLPHGTFENRDINRGDRWAVVVCAGILLGIVLALAYGWLA